MSKSLREMKRQAARKDAHQLRMIEASPVERQQAALFRNGITHEDVKREYLRGRKDGVAAGRDFAFKLAYAGTLLCLIEEHGMKPDDAVDLLCLIDNRVKLCIEDTELADEVYEKYGVRLEWEDPIERIQRV